MFTGIVEEVGTVRAADQGRLTIAARRVMPTLEIGGSINVNGTCLTVTRLDSGVFAVDVVPETLRRTNLGLLRDPTVPSISNVRSAPTDDSTVISFRDTSMGRALSVRFRRTEKR